MALLTFDRIKSVGEKQYGARMAANSARAILAEDTKSFRRNQNFDVFLSHSYADAKLNYTNLLYLCGFLERYGYSVYVDWIIDKELNRSEVTGETARTLRRRMNNSKCLLFATSKNSMNSRWMPWELGYKDGNSVDDSGEGMVGIIPIMSKSQSSYKGQEYLGIYPYITEEYDTEGKKKLWVNRSPNSYITFDYWLKGKKPYRRT